MKMENKKYILIPGLDGELYATSRALEAADLIWKKENDMGSHDLFDVASALDARASKLGVGCGFTEKERTGMLKQAEYLRSEAIKSIDLLQL